MARCALPRTGRLANEIKKSRSCMSLSDHKLIRKFASAISMARFVFDKTSHIVDGPTKSACRALVSRPSVQAQPILRMALVGRHEGADFLMRFAGQAKAMTTQEYVKVRV
jgi:hypothetical protein